MSDTATATVAIERIGTDTIRYIRMLDAPVETVWRYLTDSELRAQWFAGGPMEQKVGGVVELMFDHDNLSADDVPYPEKYRTHKCSEGRETVIEIDPPHVLALSWVGGKEGVARFELAAVGNDRTRLMLTHSGISGPAPMANFGGGWHSHLAVLQGVLRGERVRDFWALHARSEAEVARILGV